MNPIIFEFREQEPGFIAFSRHLGEFDWHDKLVALTDNGFLVANEKVAKLGHYEFLTVPLPWNEIEHVEVSRCFGLKGLLCAVLLAVSGLLATYTVWTNWVNDGPKPIKLAVAGCAGSLVLLFGARRNRIQARAGTRTFTWMSDALTYTRTRPLCELVTSICVDHNTPHCSCFSCHRAG